MKINKVILFAGPSGVGKGKIKENILENSNYNLVESVSVTTRPKRQGEMEGKNYIFVSKNRFEELINEDAFVEWAEYVGNYYGTLKSQVSSIFNQGKNALLEIEIQGVQNALNYYDHNQIIIIFLLPPSFTELFKRLSNRLTESEEEIVKRVNQAKVEIKIIQKIYNQKKSNFSKYIVINKDIDLSILQVNQILKGELIDED